MITGPGTIAGLIMFSSQGHSDPLLLLAITSICGLVLLITMIVMLLSSYFEKILGKTGISVIQRIMGLILCALAVQFIINGMKEIGVIVAR